MATVMKNVIVPLDKEMTSKNLSDCVKNFDVDYLFVTDETKQKTENDEFSKPENLKILNIDDEDFKKVFKDESADKEKCIEDFFEYVRNRVHYLPSDVSLDWFGCFPILDENNILIDFHIFLKMED